MEFQGARDPDHIAPSTTYTLRTLAVSSHLPRRRPGLDCPHHRLVQQDTLPPDWSEHSAHRWALTTVVVKRPSLAVMGRSMVVVESLRRPGVGPARFAGRSLLPATVGWYRESVQRKSVYLDVIYVHVIR